MSVMPWSKGDDAGIDNPALKIENIRETQPRWGRRYVTRLDERATLTVSAESYIGRRWISGELRQPNGKNISFDPKEIADKIIDRTLVPLVERACEEILSLDRAYMASNRPEFLDETGARWERAA